MGFRSEGLNSWQGILDHLAVRNLGTSHASKNLERMARAAIVRSNEAPRSEDTGTKYPTEGQRSMAGREQVLMQVLHAIIAAGARFFEVPQEHELKKARLHASPRTAHVACRFKPGDTCAETNAQ